MTVSQMTWFQWIAIVAAPASLLLAALSELSSTATTLGTLSLMQPSPQHHAIWQYVAPSALSVLNAITWEEQQRPTSVVAEADRSRAHDCDAATVNCALRPRHHGQPEAIVREQHVLDLHAEAASVVHDAHLGGMVRNGIGDAAAVAGGGAEVQEADAAGVCHVGGRGCVVHAALRRPA